jgi:hypothetical protein
MPFAVKQWPDNPDPREPDFAVDGWDVGQLPPFVWRMSTTNATGVYEHLNDGVDCTNVTVSPSFSTYRSDPGQPNAVDLFILIAGFQTVQTVPEDHTIEFELRVTRPPGIRFEGKFYFVHPVAIQQHDDFGLAVVLPDAAGTIPDDMTITPRKWNV